MNTNLDAFDLAVVIGYFGLVLIVGIGSSLLRGRGDSVDGFFLAGRRMSWLPVGASLFASNIGSEHFIGLAGTGAATGIAVGAFEINALVLLQLLGFVFLPVYMSSGVSTLPEYLRLRFGGQRMRSLITLLSLALYIFTKISVNLFSGSLFIQQALHWDLWTSTALLLAMTTLCTIVGGLTSVIYMDVLQVVVMILGSSLLLYKGLNEIGGWHQLQTAYMKAWPNVTVVSGEHDEICGLPKEDAWQMLRDADDSEMPWPGFILGQTPASIWYWCADQMMVQKALSSRSLRSAQCSTLFTGWLKTLPLFLMVIPGMISRVLYADEVGCVHPEICERVCGNAVGCSNIAFPKLVLGVMPVGLRGVMVAVMLAALMSDLTSIFNSASSLFTMDIYRQMRGKASQRELVLVARLTIIVLVLISIAWIPFIQRMQKAQLYIYIQAIAAYLTPPIAVIFSMAITWTRLNEPGAFWALVLGMGLGLLRMIIDFGWPQGSCVSPSTSRPNFLLANMHYMYFAALSFWTTGILAIVISLCTQKPEQFRLLRTTVWTKRWQRAEQIEMAEQKNDKIEESCHSDDEEQTKSSFINFSSEAIANLNETKMEKLLIKLNLFLILTVALAMYTYFSLNPFSVQEIRELRANVTISNVHL